MKTTDVYDIKRSGDLGGQKVAMKFDENSIAHIMSVLTELYSDNEMACVREYSTNARDSQIEAGITRPIEITLPNSMNPYFKVKDFGVGLSVDDISNIYSKYGASTKRDTNTQSGMLGLGCKSALAYTSQFTITSVKNGVKATVVVSRIEDGTGVMEIVDTVATNDFNGVEISIPVKPQNSFAAKAAKFFQFWEPGTVLVNGEQPKRIELQMVTKTIGIAKNLSSDTIVMGGVPYPVENDGLYDGTRPYGDRFQVVAFVEIGEIGFVPSREALATTPRTDAKVAEIKKAFLDNLLDTAKAEISACATHAEAFKVYQAWMNRCGRTVTNHLIYKGEKFDKTFSFKAVSWNMRHSRYSMRNNWSYPTQFGIEQMVTSLMISGYDGMTVTPRHKEKIRHYRTAHGLDFSSVLFTDQPEGDVWVPATHRVTWADIKAIKLPSTAGPRNTNGPVYSQFDTTTGWFKDVTVLDATKPIVFCSPRGDGFGRNNAKNFLAAFPGVQVVEIAENRWDKFKRDYPIAKHAEVFGMEKIKAAADALTPQDLKVMAMDNYSLQGLKMLDENLVDDPDLKDAIVVAKGNYSSATLKEYNRVIAGARYAGAYAPDLTPTKSAMTAYPLAAGNISRDRVSHVYLYVNAVYAENQAKIAQQNAGQKP